MEKERPRAAEQPMLLPQEQPFDIVALYGNPVEQGANGAMGKVYHLHNHTGVGVISVYDVLPGIRVVYNDLHMGYCNQDQGQSDRVIEINHCREGRYECRVGRQTCCYMAPGDFAIGGRNQSFRDACFPTSHYHGISIFLELDRLTEDLRRTMDLLSIDLEHIFSLVCGENHLFIVRANESIAHIFSELYSVREQRKQGYLTVKILELLLFLSDLERETAVDDRAYLNSSHVQKLKEVRESMVEDLRKHHTIEELSRRVGLSPTALKKGFRKVYGVSVYAYLKAYRLQEAQRLLLRTEDSIAQVAGKVGYENPNKFASAFKGAYGVSPTAFRRESRERIGT